MLVMTTSKKFSILASFIIIFMTSQSSATIATCSSVCSLCGTHDVWCGGVQLTAIPRQIPNNISLLYLVNNNISYIRNNDVTGFRATLKALYMKNNKLRYESLESGSFQIFTSLETLELNRNLFTSIRPDLLAGMTNLKNLQMMDNRISRIYPGAFDNLTQLTDIQLSGNRIISLPQLPELPKLNRLLLAGNKISRLQYSFRKLKALTILSISNNSLTELGADQFPEKIAIKNLFLARNNFKQVPQAIRYMSNLRELNMAENPISSLPSDMMNHSIDFNYLDIKDMQLRQVGANFIPDHIIFNNIKIAGNPWKCDCEIKHLVNFIKTMANSFSDTDEARCSEPLSKRGILIKDLDISAMNCKSETRNEHLDKNSVGDCSKLTCSNGGTCVRGIGGIPTCRCTADWKGETCIEPNNHLPIRNSTRKVHTIPEIADMEDYLVLEEGSITARTVTIMVPQTNSEYLIRVSEIINNKGDMLERQKYKIKPDHRTYVVGDLASGATYRVCLVSISIAEEEMCSTVRTIVKISPNTPPTSPPTTKPNILRHTPDDDVIKPILPVNPQITPPPPVVHPPRKPAIDQSPFDIVPETGESLANFDTNLSVQSEAVQDQSVYLLIGAGIGAFVILLFGAMIFVFLRNKRRKLRSSAGSSDSAGGGSDDTRRYADIVGGHDTEMTPLAIDNNGMTYQQHRTTPSPPNGSIYYKQQQHAPTSRIISYHQPVTNNNTDMYHITDAGSCRTGSPNRNNGSLGRSSISGGSGGGAHLYEQQHNRGYSPLTNNTAGNSVAGEPMDDIQYVAVSGRGSYTTGSPLPITHPVVQQRVGVPQQINSMYGHRDIEQQRARNPSEISRQSPMIAPDLTYPRPPSVRASTTSINHQFHHVGAPPIVVSRVNHQTYTPAGGHHVLHTQQQQRSSRQSYSGQMIPASPCLLTDSYNGGGVIMPKVRGIE